MGTCISVLKEDVWSYLCCKQNQDLTSTPPPLPEPLISLSCSKPHLTTIQYNGVIDMIKLHNCMYEYLSKNSNEVTPTELKNWIDLSFTDLSDCHKSKETLHGIERDQEADYEDVAMGESMYVSMGSIRDDNYEEFHTLSTLDNEEIDFHRPPSPPPSWIDEEDKNLKLTNSNQDQKMLKGILSIM